MREFNILNSCDTICTVTQNMIHADASFYEVSLQMLVYIQVNILQHILFQTCIYIMLGYHAEG